MRRDGKDVAVTVVKVGGSLLADAGRLKAVLAGLADGRDGPAVIVPGGGPFADAVRAAQDVLGFGDPLAHRLALEAMGHMAAVFREVEPRLRIVSDEDEAGVLPVSGAAVWDPVRLRGGHAEIAETWAVTSDSLALWLATRLRAARCILVKSALCPAGADPAALAGRGLVDRAFPEFARRFGGEIVIRGPHGQAVLNRGRTAGNPSSPPSPHPEVPAPAGFEGALRKSQPSLAVGSFEARRRPAPQDEGGSGRLALRDRGGDAAP